MKNKTAFVVGIFLLMFVALPFASADLIEPGYTRIPIHNYVTNIDDYPNYVFVSGPSADSAPGISMCPIQIINESGLVDSYYKFCTISVYAIPKDKFSIEEINKINSEANKSEFEKIEKIEVLGDLSTSKSVPISSTEGAEIINHEISLDGDNNSIVKIDRNPLIYVYIIAPIIALLIIIWLVMRRRK